MKALEQQAAADYALGNVSEFVALGFIVPGSDTSEAGPEVYWYALTNEHTRDEFGRQTEFHVSGDQLRQVFGDVMHRADTSDDPVVGDMTTWSRVLWHSHPLSVEPSVEDIRDFPTGLCDYGLVYHAPSGRTTLYNQSGVISVDNTPAVSSLTTG